MLQSSRLALLWELFDRSLKRRWFVTAHGSIIRFKCSSMGSSNILPRNCSNVADTEAFGSLSTLLRNILVCSIGLNILVQDWRICKCSCMAVQCFSRSLWSECLGMGWYYSRTLVIWPWICTKKMLSASNHLKFELMCFCFLWKFLGTLYPWRGRSAACFEGTGRVAFCVLHCLLGR